MRRTRGGQPHRHNLDWADRALLATQLAVIPERPPPQDRRPGRPAEHQGSDPAAARENAGWGYRRIHLGRSSADRGRSAPRSGVGQAVPGLSGGAMIFVLWLEADLHRRDPDRVGAEPVAAGGIVEDAEVLAAPPACGGPARTTSRSFEVDVVGSGLAGPARRDDAGRALGRVAADPPFRHDLAVALRHCPPPAGAVVAPGTFWPAAGAPHCAVGGAPAGAGERVMGVPADPR